MKFIINKENLFLAGSSESSEFKVDKNNLYDLLSDSNYKELPDMLGCDLVDIALMDIDFNLGSAYSIADNEIQEYCKREGSGIIVSTI